MIQVKKHALVARPSHPIAETLRPPSWITRHVRVYPVEEVTSRNFDAEVDPRAAGLTRHDVDDIWQSVVKLYRTGLHAAISICVRRRGWVLMDRAIGHLRGNSPGDPAGAPKRRARYDSLFNLYSGSKAITAMLIHMLDERGLVHLDDPVAEYIPEFGKNGKEWVTLRHILTHRAGIPAVLGAKVDLELIIDTPRILQLICDARPVSVPGRRLAYHALTGGYVLGEVVRRVTGRDLRTFFRDEVLRPLGFRSFDYGVSPDLVDEVAENAFTGMPAFPPYSWLLERSLGVSIHDAVKLSNSPRFLTTIVPSGNIVGTADEGSRFFQLLLNGGELDGVRIFDRRTVRRAVAEQSFLEVDSFLGVPIRYGMGFMLGSNWFSLYGGNTPRAFGHVGFTNVVAYADPDRDISVCLMTSGKPFITPGQLAWLNVARTIAKRCPRVG
jgi:CubicO group peptidase (beta-lactamase class C family)